MRKIGDEELLEILSKTINAVLTHRAWFKVLIQNSQNLQLMKEFEAREAENMEVFDIKSQLAKICLEEDKELSELVTQKRGPVASVKPLGKAHVPKAGEMEM